MKKISYDEVFKTMNVKVVVYEKTKIYLTNSCNSCRYVLGNLGNKNLIVVGINPSTATINMEDPTMRKVRTLSKNNGYDGYIMINIYPQRATNPNDLHIEANYEFHESNIEAIKYVLDNFSNVDVCLAYGNIIESRKYFNKCKEDIVQLFNDKNIAIYCFGKNKTATPKHPLYLRNDTKLIIYSD